MAGSDSLFFPYLLLAPAAGLCPSAWAVSTDPWTLGSSLGDFCSMAAFWPLLCWPGGQGQKPLCWKRMEGGVSWRLRRELRCGDAVPCPPFTLGLHLPIPEEGRGCSPDGSCRRKETVCNGISRHCFKKGCNRWKEAAESIKARARSALQQPEIWRFIVLLLPYAAVFGSWFQLHPRGACCSWQALCFGGVGKGSLRRDCEGLLWDCVPARLCVSKDHPYPKKGCPSIR